MNRFNGLGQAPQAPQAAAFNAQEAARQLQILYLSLLAQSGNLVTEVTSPINGDQIGEAYSPIFTNTSNVPIRVQAFADFTNPGVGVVLSTTRDQSDVGKVDEMSLTANGRVETVGVILMPTYSLWVRDRDPNFFPMQTNDIVRVRVFDPSKMISYSNLFPNRPI